MNRADMRIAILKAMPHWRAVLNWRYNNDDLATMAAAAIHVIDHSLAPTSETIYLGNALDAVRRASTESSLLEQLTWWDTAYQAVWSSEEASEERRDLIYDLIMNGDADLALALAETPEATANA